MKLGGYFLFASFGELNEFNKQLRSNWCDCQRKDFSDSYTAIARVIESGGDPALMALFQVCQDVIVDPGEIGS